MAKKKTTTREFSYTRPILYQGEQYPSADSMIIDENGRKTNGTIFTDANGQYYTLDSDRNIVPVMPRYDLDEVTATARNKREPLLFNSYLTRNDNTQVNNLPHREYNTSLKANAKRGAMEHALWDREHPNLSAWRDAATAVPFAVAATPFVVGGGSALLNTGLGQVARHGISALMDNPYVAGINDAVGLGVAGKGMYDVSQGKFTPETAMDIAGGAGLMFRGFNSLKRFAKGRRAVKNAREVAPTEEWVAPGVEGASSVPIREEAVDLGNVSPAQGMGASIRNIGTEMDDVDDTVATVPFLDEMLASRGIRTQSSLDRVREDANAREIFNRTLQEQRAAQENNAPARLLDDYDNSIVQPDASLQNITRTGDTTELPFLPDGTPNPNYHFSLSDPVEVQDVDLGLTPSDPKKIYISARNVKTGEAPYTEEEVNSWIDPTTGRLKKGIEFNADSEVDTGAHGEMFMPDWYPEQDYNWILKQHINADKIRGKEMKSILAANPTDRSGILVDTHNGDTSMDSTPLAYKVATRLGKKFKPMTPLFNNNTVRSNSFGYNSAFKQGYSSELKRAEALFKANPDYKAAILRDSNGNMIAYELTDENGTFQIPLNSRQEVMDIMNNGIHIFNKHFGTSYPDVTPYSSRKGTGDIWSGSRTYYRDVTPETMYPWDFGEEFEIPNIYGIAYKRGGKIRRKLLTQL